MKLFVKAKLYKIKEPYRSKDELKKNDELVKCVLIVRQLYIDPEAGELTRKIKINSNVPIPLSLEGTEQILEVEITAYKKSEREVAISYKCIAIAQSVATEQKGK